MFWPNTHKTSKISVRYSHRHKDFLNTYEELKNLFCAKFLLKNYDILFIPGSGSVAVEAVIASLKNKPQLIGNPGKFRDRWDGVTARHHNSTIKDSNSQKIQMFCQLETSNSSIYYQSWCVIDAMSSFPYYTLPANTLAFITCSNKQLWSFAWLGIVWIHRDAWSLFREDNNFSYLNLWWWKQASEKSQTISTAPTYLFEDLLDTLRDFSIEDNKRKIETNSALLVEAIWRENIIGESICPVITVPKKHIPSVLAEKWWLFYAHTDNDVYQLFTFSCPDEKYREFAEEISQYKNNISL